MVELSSNGHSNTVAIVMRMYTFGVLLNIMQYAVACVTNVAWVNRGIHLFYFQTVKYLFSINTKVVSGGSLAPSVYLQLITW
jgi:hypothetical protein